VQFSFPPMRCPEGRRLLLVCLRVPFLLLGSSLLGVAGCFGKSRDSFSLTIPLCKVTPQRSLFFFTGCPFPFLANSFKGVFIPTSASPVSLYSHSPACWTPQTRLRRKKPLESLFLLRLPSDWVERPQPFSHFCYNRGFPPFPFPFGLT